MDGIGETLCGGTRHLVQAVDFSGPRLHRNDGGAHSEKTGISGPKSLSRTGWLGEADAHQARLTGLLQQAGDGRSRGTQVLGNDVHGFAL